MPGFKAAVMIEMYKLIKKKKIFAAAVLSIVAVIVGQIALLAIKGGMGLKVAGSAEFPMVVLTVFIYTILPLFTAMVAIDMFSGEFSSNTMKITLAKPVSRFGIYSAKVLNIALFIMANLLFVMMITIVAGLIFNDTTSNLSSFLKVLISYITTFLPVFTFSLFIVMLSNILKGGLSVFFLSILTFICLTFLEVAFSRYSSFFITSMFGWYRLWISDAPNIFKIIRQFLIMIGCGIMFFTAGYYLFEKRDL